MEEQRKTIIVELPAELHTEAEAASERGDLSLDDFIADAVAEKISASNFSPEESGGSGEDGF